MTRLEVRIGGFGGQGVVTAAYVLGMAASIFEGKSAAQTDSYGPESRGGASISDIIISDQEVRYPMVDSPDVVIALSQPTYERCCLNVKKDGVVVYDIDLVRPKEAQVKMIGIPLTRIAEEAGNKIAANMVSLGALCGITKSPHPDSVRKAIRESLRQRAELNLKAFEEGLKWVTK